MRIIGGLLLDNEKRATMEEFYRFVETTTQLLDGICVMTNSELGEFINIVEYRVQHDDLYHPVSEYLDVMRDVLAGREAKENDT